MPTCKKSLAGPRRNYGFESNWWGTFLRDSGFVQLLDNGWQIHTTLLSENFSWESYQEQHKAGFLPLFMITGEHILRVLHADETIAPVSGDRILALIAPTAA